MDQYLKVSSLQKYIQQNFIGFVVFCHLLFALLFFSPYFLFNHILLANSDMPNLHLPIFIWTKRNLLQGQINFWYPYVLGGSSLFLYSLAPIYSVLDCFNWLLFVLPEKYLFLVATFLSFVKLWLTGVFAYLIFNEELKNERWAFFASTIYQLCGYTFWHLFFFDAMSMWLWTTVAIFLIWTTHKRRAYLNYIFLTLVLVQMFLPSYIIPASYVLILLIILILYRYLSQLDMPGRFYQFLTSATALPTAGLIFMLRLLPTWAEAQMTSRVPTTFNWDFRDLSFLGLRLFDPEILGVHHVNSYPIIAPLFNGIQDDLNTLMDMPHFFGILPVLLVLWAVVFSQNERATFWLGYAITTFLVIIRFEPLDTVMHGLLGPAYHHQGLQVFLPIGFCMVAGLTGKNLAQSGSQLTIPSNRLLLFAFAVVSILAYILIVWLTHFPQQAYWVGPVIISAGGLTILSWLVYRQRREIMIRVFFASSLVVTAALILLCLYFILFTNSINQTFLAHLKVISASLILLSIVFIGLLVGSRLLSRFGKIGLYPVVFIIVGLMLVVLYPYRTAVYEPTTRNQDFLLAILGALRFIIISLIFMLILYRLRQQTFQSRWLLPCFLFVLIFDLLPTAKIHSFLSTAPFYEGSQIYPPEQVELLKKTGESLEIDDQNYRVNWPNTMLQLPYYQGLYGNGETVSSMFTIYGLRTYGGYYNGVSNRYRQFVSALAPSVRVTSHGVPASVEDDRFLDLFGVRFGYGVNTEAIKVRPNALSRFMFFTSYEIIENGQKILERLNVPQFSPIQTIILDKDPGIPLAVEENPAEILSFVEQSTDEIEVQVASRLPGIILFNDTYHPDWKAYLNGKEQPVLHANYNFMAIPVPAGQSQVIFRYEPKFFYYGAYFALTGIVLFFIISLLLYGFKNQLDARTPHLFFLSVSSLRQKVSVHLKTFKLSYSALFVLLLIAITQAIFNYHEAKARQTPESAVQTRMGDGYETVFLIEEYRGFLLIQYKFEYYAIPSSLAPNSPTSLSQDVIHQQCQEQGKCAIGSSLAQVKQLVELLMPKLVVMDYKGFNIIIYNNKFYALRQDLDILNEGLDPVSFANDQFLQNCQAHGQCAIGNSLEETKQLVDLMPKLVMKNYQGFDIISYYYKYYIFTQGLNVLDRALDPAEFAAESFLQECQAHGQCAVGNSLEEAKQLVDLMPKLVMKNYQGFDIVSYYYKYYIFSQELNVLDHDLDPARFTDERFLEECQVHGQCAIANSPEEAKQLVDLLMSQTP